MRFSLQTREIIADSIETVTCAQHHDACIAIPGCDKNMPGVIMAFARHNRPSIMVYGGSIKPGYSETLKKQINISTCYESHGAYIYKNLKSAEDGKFSADEIMEDIERNACPGAGACGGMYTANTMSTSIEGRTISSKQQQPLLPGNYRRRQYTTIRLKNPQKLHTPTAALSHFLTLY